MIFTFTDEISHDDLVARARTFLLNDLNCGFAVAELVTASAIREIPDAIGFRNGARCTVLIECKTSRSDFHADGKKLHRRNNLPNLGNVRYYMTPKDMVTVDELPAGWGLIETRPYGGRLAAEVKYGPSDQIRKYRMEDEFWHDADRSSERDLMYSALRRVEEEHGLQEIIEKSTDTQ